jgi:hypothetical protein
MVKAGIVGGIIQRSFGGLGDAGGGKSSGATAAREWSGNRQEAVDESGAAMRDPRPVNGLFNAWC